MKIRLPILPLISFLAVCVPCMALGQSWNGLVDPSNCYSALLQRTDIYHDNERLKLALLSTIDKSTLEQVKANGSITAIYSGIPFTAGFNAFKDAQTHYFEQHSLNVDHERETFSVALGLDPQASKIFGDCINALALGNYGLSAYGTAEDESTTTIALFWRPTIAGQQIKILDSTVVNAVVVGGDSYKGKLFPPKGVSFKDSRSVTLERTNPDKQITITLVTDPDVRVLPIRIRAVPPLYSCELKDLTKDPVTHAEFSSSEPVQARDHLGGSAEFGTGFTYSKTIDGLVTDVFCDKHGADHIEFFDRTGRGSGQQTPTATCAGSMDDGPRTFQMTFHWFKPFNVCTAVPWLNNKAQPVAILDAK
jgi:hypothetical protein